ncbi:hypothetical protein DXA71_06970 [Parabacteroides distasonis]|nr:hypothetical protein DXA71_06970 [Parabacteroides distasonis]
MAAIKSYKGFDKNLKCRDFQYEIGKEYEMDGEIKVCNRGFHACESPFDVFDHYTMIDSRFCEVEQDGNISKEDRGTKICSSKIKIKAELKLADMINLGVEWLKEITSPEKIKTSIKDNSSGYGAQIGSSGYDAQIGSSGYGAKIGSSGNGAKIGSSGYGAKIDSTGEGCVIMCAGINSVAKASKGSWITLSEWSYSDKKKRYIPVCVKTEFVDGEKIKADTYYKLAGGVFKEIQ